jgi:hypothetical protein
MSTDTEPAASHPSARRVLLAAVASGVVAGVGMGVVLSVGTGLLPLIGALYGQESVAWGWLSHLFNSVVFALLFAAAVSRPIARPNPPRLGTYVAYGLVYGALLEIVTGGVLFPLWLAAAAEPELAVPFFPVYSDNFVWAIVLGIAHLVYGVLLGAGYAVASGAVRVASGESGA